MRARRPSSRLLYLENSASGKPVAHIYAELTKRPVQYISLVPPQTPEQIEPLVQKYLEFEFGKLNTKNKMTVENLHGGKPWMADHKHWSFEAAKKATEVR